MPRTPKALALGGALRQARKDRGLTLRALALQINRDAGVLSRWETGERTPRPECVAQLLTVLGVNGDGYDEIMTLAYGTDEPQWAATTLPEQRQQLAAFLDAEQGATKIIEVAPLLVPGLLQASGYIRAIMSGGGVPSDDITTRVAVRIGRRDVIERANKPAQLVALISEGVLYQDIGGPGVTIEQIRHLVKEAQRPNVDVRIVPYRSGWHPALDGSFSLIESEQPTVVFLETRRSGLCLYQDDDVAAYKHAANMVLRVAMSSDDSVSFLANLANRMEKIQ